MSTTRMPLIVVADQDWNTCPYCGSKTTQAVENGFRVNDISTDLVLCLDCRKLYVVFPEGQEPPKDSISVHVPAPTILTAQEHCQAYEMTLKTIGGLQ